MRLASLMNHPLISHFLRNKRVLVSEERALLEQAQELLREAQEQAAQMLSDARQQAEGIVQKAEQLKQHAVSQAQREAREAAARTLATQGSNRARSMVSMDERIGVLVTRTLGKVLNEAEVDQRFFASVLQKVLRAAREEKFLSVRVCPEQLDAARQSVHKLIEQVGATPFVDVVADPELRRGSCLVESEHGVIDASLDTQLEAIKLALTNVWSASDV